MGNKLISCLDPYQKIEGIRSKAGFTGFYAFFLRPDRLTELHVPAQGCTALLDGFRLKSGGGSKAAKKLGDFLETERTQAMSKPRGEGPSPPFSIAPQVLSCGPLHDHACLRLSLP